jgi:hypothetical protein
MAEYEDDFERESRRARPARPTTPMRPAAPASPSSSDGAEPAPPDPSESPDEEQTSQPMVVDDDDTIAIPAPPPEVFAPRPTAAAKKRTPAQAGIELRRTLIPILLTFGVSLPIIGAWWFTRGLALPITMFVVGAVLLLLAVLNMLQVRAMLYPPGTRSGATPQQTHSPR